MKSKVIFLLSLPRSGSTYVQNLLLNASDELCSGPESWVIPFYLQLMDPLTVSISGASSSRVGVGQYGIDLNDVLSANIDELFLSIQKNGKVYLDKTPRNHLHIGFIERTYGLEACMVLIRNPIDIVNSYISTFHRGILDFSNGLVDFSVGSSNLLSAIDRGAYVMKYEEIKKDPEAVLSWINILGLTSIDDNELGEITKNNPAIMSGYMGDPKFLTGDKTSTKYSFIQFIFSFCVVRLTNLSALQDRYYPEDRSFVGAFRRRRHKINSVGLIDLLSLPVSLLSGSLSLKLLRLKITHNKLFFWVR